MSTFAKVFIGIGVTVVAGNIWEMNRPKKKLNFPLPTNVPPYRAIILGSTGAVGTQIVKELLLSKSCKEVIAISRRPVKISDFLENPSSEESAKFKNEVIDFDKLHEYKNVFEGFDVAFCALGTTIKSAGSQANFTKIDHDYVIQSAELLKNAGTKEFSYVSSVGADPNSSIFYPRSKGETEEDLKKLKFDHFQIWRPGLLLTPRTESRPAEYIAQCIFPYLDFMCIGSLRKYKSVTVSQVAKAMVREYEFGKKDKNVKVHEYDSIEMWNNI